MKNFFPSTIKQSIFLVIIFFICLFPFVFISNQYLKHLPFEELINFMIAPGVLSGIGIFHIINRRRGFSYDFKLSKLFILPLSLIVVVLFQVGFYSPCSKFLTFIFYPASQNVSPFVSVIAFIGPVILAPFFEEIIFRNYILKGLLNTYSPQKAIISSAIIFGLLHIYPHQLIGAIPLGFFFGWIYYKTRSIGVTIILHSVANLTGLFTSYVHFKLGSNQITSVSDIYGDYSIYIILVSLALLGYLMKKLIHKVKLTELKEIA
ncbi:lysostaphin resistance A-like protein [Marinifilum sp. RC60d5]|uniref:lysostaphin resistance A-like protein n=1 Tax=Marinifilum sp. RC60d5 TaxID=3458414 RepID=UPI00403601AC